MSQQPYSEEPQVGEVRFRVPLPIVIPFGALAIIAVIAIGFSKVLLSIPHEAATIVAIAVAANVLGVCAYIAFRRNISGPAIMELIAILIYPVLIGIVIANVNIGEHAAEAPQEETGGGGEGGGLVVAAANIAFDVSEIAVPAGEEVALEFNNDDSVEHNISVYPDQEAGVAKSDALFTGDIIQGGQSTTYDMGPFEKGEYFYQCDVHPNMNGPLVAK